MLSCETIREDASRLTVRVMCLDYHSDGVLTHEVTIRELPDGGWQYLGNRILERDPVEQPSPQAGLYSKS